MLKYTVKISGTGSGDLTTALTVESGRPVYVNGFIASAVTAATITLASGDGATTYGSFALATNTTLASNIEFYAFAGLRISSSQTNSTAIVFHSQAGA